MSSVLEHLSFDHDISPTELQLRAFLRRLEKDAVALDYFPDTTGTLEQTRIFVAQCIQETLREVPSFSQLARYVPSHLFGHLEYVFLRPDVLCVDVKKQTIIDLSVVSGEKLNQALQPIVDWFIYHFDLWNDDHFSFLHALFRYCSADAHRAVRYVFAHLLEMISEQWPESDEHEAMPEEIRSLHDSLFTQLLVSSAQEKNFREGIALLGQYFWQSPKWLPDFIGTVRTMKADLFEGKAEKYHTTVESYEEVIVIPVLCLALGIKEDFLYQHWPVFQLQDPKSSD